MGPVAANPDSEFQDVCCDRAWGCLAWAVTPFIFRHLLAELEPTALLDFDRHRARYGLVGALERFHL
jgi:hypothetical protein